MTLDASGKFCTSSPKIGIVHILDYMYALFECQLWEFLDRFLLKEKIRSSGSINWAGAVIKNLTFDSIVSTKTGGLVEVWNPARQAPNSNFPLENKTIKMETKCQILFSTFKIDIAWKIGHLYSSIMYIQAYINSKEIRLWK